MSPPSPRGLGPDADGAPRSHPITISPPNALSPSRSHGSGALAVPSHSQRHGSSSMHGSRRDRVDPELARERQMQQDMESAMSMSRARSGSMTAPDASPVVRPSMLHHPSNSPIDERPFPGLSDAEEEDMDRARSAAFRLHDERGSDDGHHSASHEHDEDRGEGMMDSRMGIGSEGTGYDSHSRLLPDRPGHERHHTHMSHHGHGHGHPHMDDRALAKNNFDFSPMEEFARNESKSNDQPWMHAQGRRSSAEAIDTNGGSYNTMERTNTISAYGDDPTGSLPKEETPFHRRRQRKLSQSNPVQRRQGKLALFEGFGQSDDTPQSSATATAFKAPRQPKNLSAMGGGFVPFTDAAPGHDRPYRFSFYSNALPVTIHARTLAELPAEGQTFEDLFKGPGKDEKPQVEVTDFADGRTSGATGTPNGGQNAQIGTKTGLLAKGAVMGGFTPPNGEEEDEAEAATWWLDVLSPTDDEMRMLSKVFGIHPLTTEDILLEETREKIELFRNYYLVCFRSFDQDPYSQTYLEPLNMYIIVFREGTLSFHFRGTPHPQNVRRRIKHLKDYISVTSDWISYALIDDITDAFGPLIQSIEYEVDSIDELVLILKEAEQSDMLRRIGTCRKKVMGLLRLMGNKADVVKGLAKRCNEQWLVAPKSDIGLYLSDIQDHLITMTQNLNHYEKILSRSHSNYLAQISIEMTDANNQINDVLSKLTALGTVLIPMNLVTGLWGMNVHVPGQDVEHGYAWFGGILGGLAMFACVGAFATYKCFVR